MAAAADERAGVRAYLARLPPKTRAALGMLRRAIHAAAPNAVEGISYSILVFRLDGRPVVWCAGWNEHVSLYPVSETFARARGIDVSGYKTSKGTIRFPLTAPPPAMLVRKLVKARVADVREVLAAKKAKKAKKARARS